LLTKSFSDHLPSEPSHDVVYTAGRIADEQKHRP
jgi:hypothetical protein